MKFILSTITTILFVSVAFTAPKTKSCQCAITGICTCTDCGCDYVAQIPKPYEVSAAPRTSKIPTPVKESVKLDVKYNQAMYSLKEGETVIILIGCTGDGVTVDSLPGYKTGDVIECKRTNGIVYGTIIPEVQTVNTPRRFAPQILMGFGGGNCANGQCGR